MSEFRLNPATQEWVIIAAERASRPDDFRREGPDRVETPKWDAACPFCAGNEGMTPPEVYRDPHGSADGAARGEEDGGGQGAWRVRIVPNKFPAVDSTRRTDGRRGFFNSMPGAGAHDVVIETPVHNRFTPLLGREELRRVLRAYRWRYLGLRDDPRIRLITIFKNHGRRAGTSLIHPHSQIIATPVVPLFLQSRLDVARRYHEESGRCVYRDMLKEELDDGRRIVCENGHFVAFCPYASKSPFEVWILPRRACASFGAVSDGELDGLADVLGRVLGGLWEALENPAFNYVIRTVPVSEEGAPHYVWHVEIVPRVTTPAGFELGSGISINASAPEKDAPLLRGAIEARASGA